VNFGGIRIGGLSGIYKHHDYSKGIHEYPPFNSSTCRTIYHIRTFDVFKLKLVTGAIDVFLSHDWPRGIYYHGNVDELLRRKPFFREEVALYVDGVFSVPVTCMCAF
jgi:lariat debranching enzyme